MVALLEAIASRGVFEEFGFQAILVSLLLTFKNQIRNAFLFVAVMKLRCSSLQLRCSAYVYFSSVAMADVAIDPKDDVDYLLERIREHNIGACRSLVLSRRWFFNFQSKQEMSERMEQWDSMFVRIVKERPLVLKSSVWSALEKLYEELKFDKANIKNDGFAMKQMIMHLVHKSQVCTDASRQCPTVKRLLSQIKVEPSLSTAAASSARPVTDSVPRRRLSGKTPPRQAEASESAVAECLCERDSFFTPSPADKHGLIKTWSSSWSSAGENTGLDVLPTSLADKLFPPQESLCDTLESSADSQQQSKSTASPDCSAVSALYKNLARESVPTIASTPSASSALSMWAELSRSVVRKPVSEAAVAATAVFSAQLVTEPATAAEKDVSAVDCVAARKKRSAADILASYGASHVDKSEPPVPPRAANLLALLVAEPAKRHKTQSSKPATADVPLSRSPRGLSAEMSQSGQQGPSSSEAQQPLAAAPETEQPPAADAAMNYDEQRRVFSGSNPEWARSEIRMACIAAMKKNDVRRRRFEAHRTDLFKWDEQANKWICK